MPSLVKILRRCHSTVRADRNSWAPISGLVRPSRASRAMSASCGVSVVIGVSTRALAHRLAGGDQLPARALGERRHADRGEHVVGGTQLLARMDAPAFAAQPLPVEQVRAGQLRTQPGPA